jgi:hypothetical protein
MMNKTNTMLIVALVATFIAAIVIITGCGVSKKRNDNDTLKKELENAISVSIKSLYSGDQKSISLTGKSDIVSLVSKMDFSAVRPCECKYKYEVVFSLADGRNIKLYSFPDGWVFENDTIAERGDSMGFCSLLDILYQGKAKNH